MLGLALAQHLSRIGQECQVASALNFSGQCPLVLGACTGLAAWADFTRIGHVTLQHFDLLVIQFIGFVSTERTFLWGGKKSAPARLAFT